MGRGERCTVARPVPLRYTGVMLRFASGARAIGFARGALLAGAAILVFALSGCSSMSERAYAGAPAYVEESYAAADRAPAPSRLAAPQVVASEPEAPSAATGGTPAAGRLRVYSADLVLVVPSVDAARDRIVALVEEAGGYVEYSEAAALVVRVPAARSDDALALIEREGTVRERAISTADVTEQYADLERRLEIARASRARLHELLDQTEDADEQVSILREIRRLSEEIEQLDGSLRSLAQLVAFSRITVRLIPRISVRPVDRPQIPFAWIAGLDPLSRTLGPAVRSLAIDVPDSFAVFEEGDRLRAESADGVRLRAGGRSNDPAGDAEFWSNALVYHLGPWYRSA